jgi:hypothetical protein
MASALQKIHRRAQNREEGTSSPSMQDRILLFDQVDHDQPLDNNRSDDYSIPFELSFSLNFWVL